MKIKNFLSGWLVFSCFLLAIGTVAFSIVSFVEWEIIPTTLEEVLRYIRMVLAGAALMSFMATGMQG